MGTAVGSFMLAMMNTGAAEAAPSCDNLDLSREPNILDTIEQCLQGATQPIVPPTGPIINEIEMGSCREERDRDAERARNNGLKVFKTVCNFYIPADASCPGNPSKESRMGNRFDPELTINGRTIGTRGCTYEM